MLMKFAEMARLRSVATTFFGTPFYYPIKKNYKFRIDELLHKIEHKRL